MTTTHNGTHEVLTATCACCLGRFVVDGNLPVLHGYKRPGTGSIHGHCPGMGFPAYEISTDGCVFMRDRYAAAAAQARSRAAQLEAGEIRTIVRLDRVREGYSRRTSVIEVTLTPESTPEELRKAGHWSWAELVASEARSSRREAAALDREAAVYQGAIDRWAPGLAFISEDRLNADKAEARASKADAAAQKRRFKAYKGVFFHLGAAIAKHKRGHLHPEWEWEQIYLKANPGQPNRYADVARLAPFAEMYPAAKRGKR